MKIYISHSTSFDYQTELYKPLRNFILHNLISFVLPHEKDAEVGYSKKIIPKCDLMIAEVSYPSTGMGIELGWADSANVPIIAIHKKGLKPSSSVQAVTDKIVVYDNIKDVCAKIIEQEILKYEK